MSVRIVASILIKRYAFITRTGNRSSLRVTRRDIHNLTNCYNNYRGNDSNGSTIYALSTSPGKAAIAIIRASGPASTNIYRALCPGYALPRPRHACLRKLYEPGHSRSLNALLDPSALVLFFPKPQTVTGEDVLEFHVHGGPAIVRAVLAAISRVPEHLSTNKPSILKPEIRYAEAGEFTRRAFLNNRMDLVEIEALGQTLAAETERQRMLAVRAANDVLGKRYENWRQRFLEARSELEAMIDFSEDQDFEESSQELLQSVRLQLRTLIRHMRLHIENSAKGELLRQGIKIALLGAPNAGKSSLLNRIVGREAAIVSVEEGTTRDIVDVSVDIGGFFCRLGDMAGLRTDGNDAATRWARASKPVSGETTIGLVEKEGIRRAKERALESDLIIVILSMEQQEQEDANDGFAVRTDAEVLATALRCIKKGKRIIWVINKMDRSRAEKDVYAHGLALLKEAGIPLHALDGSNVDFVGISCKEAETATKSGSGSVSNDGDPGNIQTLLKTIVRVLDEMVVPGTDRIDNLMTETESESESYWQNSLGVSQRQRENLVKCVEYLEDFIRQTSVEAQEHADIAVAAENLRCAADCLSRITGKGQAGSIEEVLGVIFEKFCIGK